MTPQELQQLQARLFELLEPAVVSLAYELVAVELVTVGGRRTVRVSVDRPSGIDLHELSRVSHAVSALLDADDPITGAYDLELSSPGIERPIQKASDYARFVGFRAKIQLLPDHPRRRFTGVLRGLDSGDFGPGRVSIEVDGVLHTIDLDTIQRTHLVLDLAEFEALAERVASTAVAPLPDSSPADTSSEAPPAPAPAPDPGGSS